MKKIILLLIMLALTSQQLFSQNQNAPASPPPPSPISAVANIVSNGTTAVVPITAINNFDSISAGDLELVFDSTVARITSITTNPLIDGTLDYHLKNGNTAMDTLIMGWFTSCFGKTLSDNSVIFNITFTKVTGGTSAINWYQNSYGMACVWYKKCDQCVNTPFSTYFINGSVTFCTDGTWLGTTSTDWNDGTNWCVGVPTAATNVVIPSSAPNWPVKANLTIGTDCNSLTMNGASQATITGNFTINAGKSVNIANNGTLQVGGNWTNSGNFNAGTGTIEFIGSNPSKIISGSPPGTNNFYDLKLSKTGGAAWTLPAGTTITVNGDMTINQ